MWKNLRLLNTIALCTELRNVDSSMRHRLVGDGSLSSVIICRATDALERQLTALTRITPFLYTGSVYPKFRDYEQPVVVAVQPSKKPRLFLQTIENNMVPAVFQSGDEMVVLGFVEVTNRLGVDETEKLLPLVQWFSFYPSLNTASAEFVKLHAGFVYHLSSNDLCRFFVEEDLISLHVDPDHLCLGYRLATSGKYAPHQADVGLPSGFKPSSSGKQIHRYPCLLYTSPSPRD